MKHTLSKLLSALLVAALLLSAVALAEEPFEGIEAVEPVETFEETETVEPVETVEEIEAVEAVEPVDEIVEEQSVDIVDEETIGGDEVYTYTGESYDAAPSEAAFAAEEEVAINAANFPDANFRKYIQSYFDTDKNGSLSATEISDVKTIVLNSSSVTGVADMTGIKRFTSLEKLHVTTDENPITSLDVSGFANLSVVECYRQNVSSDRGSLTTLNVNGCTGLKKLTCEYNQLSSLDVRSCTGLEELRCSTNQLTSLDVSGLGELNRLECGGNTISYLNISGCANLEKLFCSNSQLTALDVSGLTKLETLSVGNTPMTSLYINGCVSLKSLEISNTQLTSLNVTGLTNLESLWCDNSSLVSLNASGLKSLMDLRCNYCKLTSLKVSGCEKLDYLYCSNNKLKKLDISGCTKMVYYYTKGAHETSSSIEYYGKGAARFLKFDKGVKIITKAGQSSSGSKSKTKLTAKKSKVTAYVGTPVQMETGGETGKSFKSSNKKVATVNSAGVVTPKAAGKCKITYKTSSASYTVTLTVKDLTIPKWVALSLKGTIAAKVGEPQILTATMNDGAVSKLKWTTSDKKIATVKNGVVTFKKKGTVTITVTTVKGNKKAKVKFKVSK